MESLIPDTGSIFIASVILVIILLSFIYQSNLEKLKMITTILLIGFFSWSLNREGGNGLIIFIVIAGFVIFVWNKMYKEKQLEDKNKLIDFYNNIKTYGNYLKVNPFLGFEEIRHISKLPFHKEEFIKNSIIYIRLVEKDLQELLLATVPNLAYFQDDIPENGYISNTSKLINDNEYLSNKITELHDELTINNTPTKTIENLASKLTEKNNFQNDLYINCTKESEQILKLLKTSISIK